jgi:hypothetical protein
VDRTAPSSPTKAAGSPLQEIVVAQPAVLISLIAHIVGMPLHDDVVRTTDRLLRLPFLDTYRTMCRMPQPAFRRLLEGVRGFGFAEASLVGRAMSLSS